MRTSEADRSTRSISEPSPGRLHSSIRRKSSCAIGLPLRVMSFLYAAPQLCLVHSITANLFFSAAASSQTVHAILEVWRNTNACNISMLLLDSAHLLRYTNDDGR